jgi:hypothetical protein
LIPRACIAAEWKTLALVLLVDGAGICHVDSGKTSIERHLNGQ